MHLFAGQAQQRLSENGAIKALLIDRFVQIEINERVVAVASKNPK
jgi:hypothetical protein